MPRIEVTQRIEVDVWTAFAVSQTTGDTRLRWDPFIKRQRHLDDAPMAGPGVLEVADALADAWGRHET